MKRFFKRILFVTIPVLVIVVFFNYYYDPSGLFIYGYETRIAKQISEGNNITNIENNDDRLLQKQIINSLKICPEVACFGSSRVMEIHSENMHSQAFFNNGVSGASIEDLIAVTEIYEKRNWMPKKILIGLDPWTLNENNQLTNWKSLSDEYYSFFNKVNIGSNQKDKIQITLNKLYQLISLSYFQASIKKLMRNPSNKEFIVTKEKYNTGATILSDGSHIYEAEGKVRPVERVDKDVLTSLGSPINYLEDFQHISTKNISQIELMISRLKNKGVTIVFFLSPIHPFVYKYISETKKYSMVLETEKVYKAIAQKNGIKIIGSFNPNTIGIYNEDFKDSFHMNSKGINKLFIIDPFIDAGIL